MKIIYIPDLPLIWRFFSRKISFFATFETFLLIFKRRYLDILSVIFIDQGMRKHVKIIDGEP